MHKEPIVSKHRNRCMHMVDEFPVRSHPGSLPANQASVPAKRKKNYQLSAQRERDRGLLLPEREKNTRRLPATE
jgi:hypothetical protein